MINLIKEIKKCTIGTLALVLMICPIVAKAAEDSNDVKNQFMSLGGTENGFKTILQIVEKSRASSDTISSSIKEKYNQKLFEAMVADPFDDKIYSQIYADMQKEKDALISKNLDDMISLLKTLSLQDRKAYAQLLYGIDRVIPNSNQSTDVSKNTKEDTTVDSEINSNLDTENSSIIDGDVNSEESKVDNSLSNKTDHYSVGNTNLLN